jgi:hypothetical protein
MRGLTVRQRMMATIRKVPCVYKMPAPGYRCHSDLAAPRHGSEERHEIPRLAWKIAYCNFFVEIRMRVSPALPHVQESFCCTGTMLSRFRSLLSSRRSVPKALSALRLFRVSIRAHEAVGGKGSSWQPSKIMRNDFQTASPTAAGCHFSSNSDVRLVTREGVVVVVSCPLADRALATTVMHKPGASITTSVQSNLRPPHLTTPLQRDPSRIPLRTLCTRPRLLASTNPRRSWPPDAHLRRQSLYIKSMA